MFFSCVWYSVLTEAHTTQSNSRNVKQELLALSIPAIVGQAIDPLAQLMETAYIGRLGMVHYMYNLLS